MPTKMMDIGLVAVTGGNDIACVTGDLSCVESTGQHQESLILIAPGEFKQNPTICVGAFKYLNGEGFTPLIRKITQQFMQDGMDIGSQGIQLTPAGVIDSDAYYP